MTGLHKDTVAGEPTVWCERHQHTHIASIPRFTYLCKMCGWGQWYGIDAKAHEEACPGHETYEVEHVTVPVVEVERLRAFVDDLAQNGVRFDLNPTIDLNNMGRSYTAYLERIDKSIRERAAAVREPIRNSSTERES